MSLSKDLLSGKNISCGCAQGYSNLQHGMTGTRIHYVWKNMLSRCANERDKNYGGRGIRVCERWLTFENFYEDMGEPPINLTLDRKNNDGHYSPENCRWASDFEQRRNTRRNKRFSANGKSYRSVVDFARENGLNKYTLYKRLKKMPLDKALYLDCGGRP